MTTVQEAVRAVQGVLGTKQNKIEWQIATLGDGHGLVDAGNNMVYVRLSENSSVIQVINGGVSLTDGVLVRIEKPATDPLHWYAVRRTDQRVDENSTNPTIYADVPPHHSLHEYLGGDQINLDWRQITNMRVYAAGGLTIGVLAGLLPRPGADLVVSTQTLDLTSHVPASAGALYCLISVNSAGALVATDGATKGSVLLLTLGDIPDTPAGNFRLAAIRLYFGQTTIREAKTNNDVRDLRWPQERLATSITPGDLTLTDAHILVGNASNVAADVAMSGDATIANTGALTIANGAVSLAKMADMATASLIYRKTAGTGAPEVNTLAQLKTDLGSMPAAPAGSTTQVQYNDAGVMGADANFTWNKTTHNLSFAAGIVIVTPDVTGATNAQQILFRGGSSVTGNAASFLLTAGRSVSSGNGGNVDLLPGSSSSGTPGSVRIYNTGQSYYVAFNSESLSANRTLTFPNVAGTFALGAGTLTSSTTNDFSIAQHTHAITLSPGLLGNASAQYHIPVSGATPFAYAESGYMLDGTSGGKTTLAVTSGKTLTLTATDSFNLTIPATGTAVLGTGSNAFIGLWSGTNTLSYNAALYFSSDILTVNKSSSGAVVGLDLRNTNTAANSNCSFAFTADTVQLQAFVINAASGGGARMTLLGTGGYFRIGTADANVFYLGANNGFAITIDTAQNVGINTFSPTAKLHVVGLVDYANNAAAVAAGLTTGAFYTETGTDPKRVCVVT